MKKPVEAGFFSSLWCFIIPYQKTVYSKRSGKVENYRDKTHRTIDEIPKSTTAKKMAKKNTVVITVIVYPVSSFFFGQLTFLISEPTLRKNCVMLDISNPPKVKSTFLQRWLIIGRLQMPAWFKRPLPIVISFVYGSCGRCKCGKTSWFPGVLHCWLCCERNSFLNRTRNKLIFSFLSLWIHLIYLNCKK